MPKPVQSVEKAVLVLFAQGDVTLVHAGRTVPAIVMTSAGALDAKENRHVGGTIWDRATPTGVCAKEDIAAGQTVQTLGTAGCV